MALLTETIWAFCERQPTPELVSLLRSPEAAGPAQEALLGILGRRCRRSFDTPWQFLDWAKGNGVEFSALP